MDKVKLQAVLESHKKWVCGDGGERADLSRANLSVADLYGADLSWANLYGANLSRANLYGANLSRANLSRANLSRANLSGANLSRANLSVADLSWANLYGANLSGANLSGANLYGANLSETVLDPSREPNGVVDGFECDGEFIIGYRTRTTPHIGQYRDGRIYGADFFSTSTTECHPGLYLWPTLAMARDWAHHFEIIKVRTYPKDTHKAGAKWRCRWFEVLGTVKED